jgi:hypothetical protein
MPTEGSKLAQSTGALTLRQLPVNPALAVAFSPFASELAERTKLLDQANLIHWPTGKPDRP